MNVPSFRTIAPNLTRVDAYGATFWFSYETIIAADFPSGRRVVRRNDWGPTTGKHLNRIDGGTTEARKARLSAEAFQAAIAAEGASTAAEDASKLAA